MLADKYVIRKYTLETLTNAVRVVLSECAIDEEELDTTKINEENIDEWCWIAGVYCFINIPYQLEEQSILRQYLFDTSGIKQSKKTSNVKQIRKRRNAKRKGVVPDNSKSDSAVRIVRLS